MNPESSLLLTDLYQLTMLHGYWDRGMAETASFEFFVREMPPGRNFLVAAGLEQALEFLGQAHFREDELDWLAASGRFPAAFVDHLAEWRFSGEVWAMAEGTPFFPDEPILRVTAPIDQAQLVESRLINLLHLQTLIASKAVRCRLAAPGKLLVDFGLRRAHGAEAGLLAARAGYLAGLDGSATVLAGQRFGIPIFGTMAHSYIEAHDSELAAFESFARAQSDNVTLLIDTYDTEGAARGLVRLAPRLAEAGIRIRAVRIDSGDLAEHARRVRAILDAGGLPGVGIFSSGSLDEDELARLLAAGAPIDGFGIGTRLDTSADAPYLDCAYKLTEYAGRGRRKRSEHKATWPGRKQVYRHFQGGIMTGDTLTLDDDPGPAARGGRPLLQCVMRDGRPVTDDSLTRARERCAAGLATLPAPLRGLARADPCPVEVAAPLRALAAGVDAAIERDLQGQAG